MAFPARAKTRERQYTLGETLYAYGFITPALVAMVIASFFPVAFTIFISFTNWDLLHNLPAGNWSFVGLKNYKEIWDSIQGGLQGEIVPVVIWTLIFASFSTVINFFVGLVLAYLLNNPNMPERTFYRTVLILPWAVPGAVMTLAWTGLLNTTYGPINIMLGDLHLLQPPWLDDPNWARFSIIMVNLWFGFPFMMTACLGALQGIPNELNEAAQVDGAGIVTRFFRITLPLLRSATLPIVISTFAYNLNNFGAVYLLTSGGPPRLGHLAGSTDILPTYSYSLAFVSQRYALAAAYAVVIFFLIGGLSLMNMKYSRAFEAVDR